MISEPMSVHEISSSRGRGEFLGVVVRGVSWPRSLVLILLASLVTALVILVVVFGALAIGLRGAHLGILCFVIFVGLIAAIVLVHRRRTKRAVGKIVDGFDRATLADVFRSHFSRGFVQDYVPAGKMLARALAGTDRRGLIIRITRKEPVAIAPFPDVFEAMAIDEAGAGFAELECCDEPVLGNDDGATNDTLIPGRLKRNFKLNGGWASLVILPFVLIPHIVESWQAGRPTIGLIIWGVFIGLVFVASDRYSQFVFVQRQLLMVPGGLLVRRAKWWDRQWNLSLLRCSECVLVVARSQNRSAWRVFVAGGEAFESFHATERELHVFLRAWTSEHDPPALERLSDLVG